MSKLAGSEPKQIEFDDRRPDGGGDVLIPMETSRGCSTESASDPWGILLLFGAGSPWRGLRLSGLSDLIAARLIGITQIPVCSWS